MTLADRIVIMSASKSADGTTGWIEQIGAPKELYNEPANKFVVGFIGSSSYELFKSLLTVLAWQMVQSWMPSQKGKQKSP